VLIPPPPPVPALVTATVTMLEVDDGYVPLPEKMAVIELGPKLNADPATETEQVPPLSVQLPTWVVPALKMMLPVSAGAGPVDPVGRPVVTVAFNVVDCAVVMLIGVAVSAVLEVKALLKLLIKLVTLTEPRPVAMS
jgi:hypothetical protein